MPVTSDLIVTGPSFAQKRASTLLVAGLGMADSAAQPLASLIAGAVPQSVPNSGVVAHAGGGQANATVLTGVINEVATVATNADSVALPLAQAGLIIFVSNAAANSMQVFGSGTDTINGVATATGVAQAGGVAAEYYCTKSAPAGTWRRIQSS